MSQRPYRQERRRAFAACALLVLAYFLVPVEPDVTGLWLALRSLGTVLLVVVVALLVTNLVGRQLARDQTAVGDEVRSLIHLAVALVAGVLTFALADYVIQTSNPDQFVGLRTRVDALYFSLATLTTVGYGDVHAQGQLARVLVCTQMVFSIGVVATGASIVVKQLTRHRSTAR